ncbi:MAG: hypothetical protein ACD_60C00007G0019 [uncultured bacterium]|nr:MAG: hypothetical protein ACD_60C00007G0019 [uncultured bacterium]
MKKIILYLFALSALTATESVLSATKMQAQLTVWNMTNKAVDLQCSLLQKNETMDPAPPFHITPNESPAIQLTFQSFGKLVKCTLDKTPAWFMYIVKNADEETIKTSNLPGQPNFHYNPDYPGAVTYY